MKRRIVLVPLFFVLLILETVYFGRQAVAGFMRLGGQAAFFRSDFPASLGWYRRALAWGGDPGRIESDIVHLLLYSLDQQEAGLKTKMAMPLDETLSTARRLVGRQIDEAPHRASSWHLASEVYLHEARRQRAGLAVDLSTLPEDPLDNLLPEDWMGIAALEVATRLEPNNALYYDRLVDTYLLSGNPAAASPFARKAVAALPDVLAHAYLTNPRSAPELLEDAVRGFDDALSRESMVPRPTIEREAGRLLASQGLDARAIRYLERSMDLDPAYYDALMDLAMSTYRLKDYSKAIGYFEAGARMREEEPWPHYYAGLCNLALDRSDLALSEFRLAREKGTGEVKFFQQLGETLDAAGKTVEAERQFVAAANLNPADISAWRSLLSFYTRHDDHAAAGEVCSRIRGLAPDDLSLLEQCGPPGPGSN